jgi:hypothetical protein
MLLRYDKALRAWPPCYFCCLLIPLLLKNSKGYRADVFSLADHWSIAGLSPGGVWMAEGLWLLNIMWL